MQPSLPFSLSVQYDLLYSVVMVGCQHSGRKNAGDDFFYLIYYRYLRLDRTSHWYPPAYPG